MHSPLEAEKTPDQWRATIRRMMKKAPEVINDEKVDTLMHYHIRAHNTITLGELQGESRVLGLGPAELFQRKCSTCHSLEKALHTLRDEESWKLTPRRDIEREKVKRRMEKNHQAYDGQDR